MVWYPIQDRATANHFLSRLEQLAIPNTLYLELSTHNDQAFRLNGSALFVINPPWKLDEKMSIALPWIWSKLSVNGEGGWVVKNIS
jgi:23S rRNA (adenine2030-N6)-methyltransferase